MTDASWRRFHFAAIAFELVRAMRDGLVPVLVLIVVGGRGLDQAIFYLVAGTVAAGALAVARWNTTQWRVRDGELRRRSGIVSRNERTVPLVRIQSLDAVRGPLQRLFGVETLHVQTSGGGKGAEVELTALTRADVEALRAAVSGVVGTAAVATPEPDGPVRRLGAGGLLLAAFTAGQVGAVAAVGAASAQLVNEASGDGFALLRSLAPDTAGGWAGLALLALAASWLISVLGTVVAFSGFTLRRDGDRLRIRRGLVSVRDSAIPVRRVQAVRVVEGVLRQPLGLAAVRIETLGHGDEAPANQTLFPLVRRREVAALLETFLPEHAAGLDGIHPLPLRALPGHLAPPLALAAVVVAASAPFVGWWPVVLLAPAAGLGVVQWRAAGWRLGADGRAALRWRRLARSTLLYTADRAQTAVVGRSPLQRRAGLATLAVSVGPATGRVRGLPEPTAWELWAAARPAPASR